MKREDPMLELVVNFEESFSIFEKRRVKSTIKTDWCRTISYRGGAYSESSGSSVVDGEEYCAVAPIPGGAFNDEAILAWNSVWSVLSEFDERIFRVSEITYDGSIISHAEFHLHTEHQTIMLIYDRSGMDEGSVSKSLEILKECWAIALNY